MEAEETPVVPLAPSAPPKLLKARKLENESEKGFKGI